MAHTCSRVTLEQVEAAGTPSIASLSLMVWLVQFMHDFLPSFGTQPLSGGAACPSLSTQPLPSGGYAWVVDLSRFFSCFAVRAFSSCAVEQ